MSFLSRVIGTLYCSASITLISINVVLFLTIRRNEEFKSGTFRIIKHMCVSCVLQLVPFFVGGIMTLSGSVFYDYLDRVLGVLIQSGWFLYYSFNHRCRQIPCFLQTF
ncbi:hypothetical protein L596_021789 [Steinernema carpocapsae]|uniref:7TM GPCR serpentine receptor class x (Srx) domain-containing protein n=1 Tax=Steinernema carpocapsae TaxID=34508 RepID=A0A4U5MJU3_STECR|nr:hypothetical protein L596_021789 [Steinernema carpocapsae]